MKLMKYYYGVRHVVGKTENTEFSNKQIESVLESNVPITAVYMVLVVVEQLIFTVSHQEMCSKTVTPKTKKNTVPVVSRPVFKKATKYPPGIKICEVLKLMAELSSMTIPQTTSIPQYPPGIRIPEHMKSKH
ncbi:unnamed protein product [Caenorhabditis brenneri]